MVLGGFGIGHWTNVAKNAKRGVVLLRFHIEGKYSRTLQRAGFDSLPHHFQTLHALVLK